MRRILSDQRSRYLIVGGVNTAFGFALFTVLYLTLKGYFSYLIIFVFSQIIAVVFSHFTQRRFVWDSETSYRFELFKFAATYLFISTLNLVLLAAAINFMHFPVLQSQYLIGILLITISFFLQRRFVFFENSKNLLESDADC